MAIPKVKPSAISYANSIVANASPNLHVGVMNNLKMDSLTVELAHRIRAMSHPQLGAVCQMLSVLTSVPSPKLDQQREGARAIVASGLQHDHMATSVVASIAGRNYHELSRYAGKLTYRYILKNIPASSMVALVASQSDPAVAAGILFSKMEHNSWSKFADDYGFDVDEYVKLALPELDARLKSMGLTIQQGCALMPSGPFANGYTTNATSSGVALSPSALLAAANAAAVTTTNVPTTNTQGASTMASALSTLNPTLTPIIDNIFAQAGAAGITVASLVADAAERDKLALALTNAANDLLAMNAKCDALDVAVRQAQAAASNAMPSTISITSHSTTIPSGTVNMVQADTLFPLLSGVKLAVPHHTWAHAHPDVPRINPDYIFRKHMLIGALRCLMRGENFWLAGHTGSGKTTFVEQVAARLGWPVARVAFDSNVDRSELVGRMQLKGDGKGGTESSWLPGILEHATTNGYILLTDEIDAGHPNALYTLQPLLEGKSLTLLEDGGRIVQQSPMFRIVATGNTTGNGDPSGLYPACRILSAATLDRFQTFVNVPYMTVDEEKVLLSNSVPTMTKALITKLAKFGAELREAFVTNQTPISYSPRRSVAFAREVEDLFGMGFKDEKAVLSAAFKSKLYDAASDEFRQRLTEIASTSLGGIDPSLPLA